MSVFKTWNLLFFDNRRGKFFSLSSNLMCVCVSIFRWFFVERALVVYVAVFDVAFLSLSLAIFSIFAIYTAMY